jgi:hypothetical protein
MIVIMLKHFNMGVVDIKTEVQLTRRKKMFLMTANQPWDQITRTTLKRGRFNKHFRISYNIWNRKQQQHFFHRFAWLLAKQIKASIRLFSSVKNVKFQQQSFENWIIFELAKSKLWSLMKYVFFPSDKQIIFDTVVDQ